MAVTSPDAAPRTRRWFPLRSTDSPLSRFLALAPLAVSGVVVLGAALFGAAGPGALGAAVAALLGALALAAGHLRRHHPHALLGFANVVTLLRLTLVATLLIPLFGGLPSPTTIIVIALIVLCLDGVDGWLARRQRLSSAFGARFDMEVDSAFALVLAVLAVVVGGASWVVLLLGLPRYLFGLAGLAWPWLNGSLPPRLSRKVICVVQLAVLIAVQSPWFAGVLGLVVVLGALVALAWSFGRDILWLRQSRS